MKTTMLKTATAAAVMALATPAAAQVQVTPNYDLNADLTIDANEFNEGFAQTGSYARFDGDADGYLNEEEFNTFSQREELRGDREFGAFADYDANADGRMDEAEYNTAWFNRYDSDVSGGIDELEARGLVDDMGAPGLFEDNDAIDGDS